MKKTVKYIVYTVVAAILLYFFIFYLYLPKQNLKFSEKDKVAAFQLMKERATQYCKDYVIHPDENLFTSDPVQSRIYEKRNPEHARSHLNERLQLLFDADAKKGRTDIVKYTDGKLKIRTEEYVSLYDIRETRNYFGIVIKVTVSGRGRIAPSFFCGSPIKSIPEKGISYPPRRISSVLPKDYYFYINTARQPNVHISLDLRGSLDITKISFFRCSPKKIPLLYTVTAEVMECSDIPDPEKAPYPDCLFTVKMKGLKILEGAPVFPRFVLIVPAFKGRKKLPGCNWKKGDHLYLHMVKWQDADPNVTSIQQSDTLDDFDSDRFALMSFWETHKDPVLYKRTALLPYLPNVFSKGFSGYERPQNPPLTAIEVTKRKERIAAELKIVTEKLQNMKISPTQLNLEFEKTLKKQKKNFDIVDNTYIPKNQRLHYSFLTNFSLYNPLDLTKHVKDIKALSQYMLKHGVSFILLLCPSSHDIAIRVLFPEFFNLPDYFSLNFVKQLLENDVEVIYVFDDILKKRNEYPLIFEYPFDGHPAHGAQQVIGKQLAGYLHRHFPELIKPQYKKEMFTEKMSPYEKETQYKVNKPIWDKWFHNKRPLYPEILLNGKFIYPAETSPILLFGNSFLFTPASWQRPYFVSLLVRELGMDISAFTRTGENPMTTCIFDLLNMPEKYLKNRKLCILYYGLEVLINQKTVNIKEIDQLRKKK